jgi:hypothetical protein
VKKILLAVAMALTASAASASQADVPSNTSRSAVSGTGAKLRILPCQPHTSFKTCSNISLSGDLLMADGDAFALRTKEIVRAVVTLSGNGGSTFAAIKIGEIIHAKRYATNVDASQMCFSACAYIWIAAEERTIGRLGMLVFHPSFYVGSESIADGSGNAIIGMYMARLGYNYEDILRMIGHGPDDLHVVFMGSDGVVDRRNITASEFRAILAGER